ncbi:hypothetical protein QJS10_CPB21g00789 [Acorus calamus]|uniref:BHLH domain-containing protein n=1 Tax=Acorus calamus TaxID=4465 RepID=A0AAV9C8M4_ACOCL|nr:hypothetical protein QJS10_CPB21g00789 [Acorus calamus]
MADEFQSSICTNNNWWNMVRTAPPPPPSSMSCSAALNDTGVVGGGGVFNWLTEQPIKGRSSSCDETAVSVSCAPSDSMDLMAPAAMMDWNQALLRNSESNQTTKDWGLRIFEDASEEAFKEMNQSFLIDQTHFSSSTAADDPPVTCQGLPINRPSTPKFLGQVFEKKPNCSNNSASKSDSSSSPKKSSCEPAMKKPRIETPSSLPTFKVRKEKLGDRVTALQQLVSPFGKTDTASVLYEAIDYIKFLHDQVNNSERSKDGEGPKRDLRSRGLCLVPISSTFAVTNETTADFWTPNFGGAYR